VLFLNFTTFLAVNGDGIIYLFIYLFIQFYDVAEIAIIHKMI